MVKCFIDFIRWGILNSVQFSLLMLVPFRKIQLIITFISIKSTQCTTIDKTRYFSGDHKYFCTAY